VSVLSVADDDPEQGQQQQQQQQQQQPKRPRWRRHPPIYAAAVFATCAALFYGSRPADDEDGFESPLFRALALDTARPASRRAWTWLTYSLLHASDLHLWINLAGWAVYGAALEAGHGSGRCVAVHASSVLGAAFAVGLQARAQSKSIVLVGASGGVYGVVGAQVGHLTQNWDKVGAIERTLCLSAVVSTVVTETAVAVALANPDVSYVAHFSGFVAGVLAGLAILRFALLSPAKASSTALAVASAAATLAHAVCGTVVLLAA